MAVSFVCHFVRLLLVHLEVSFAAAVRPFRMCSAEVKVRALSLSLEENRQIERWLRQDLKCCLLISPHAELKNGPKKIIFVPGHSQI